jgi:hypothetical protein
MIALLALIVAVQVPRSADTTGAYRDERARELHLRARQRLAYVDRSITNYEAKAKERISVGLRTRLRDRLLYRRETASQINWRRGGPINIKALGAREVVPVVTAKAGVPKDLDKFLPRLAFDPMDADALLTVDTTSIRHPFSPGSEAHYRFSTGGSTTINLGERTVRLVELKVEPRRSDFRLISGSFWVDSDTYSLVQTTFRLARDIDFNETASNQPKPAKVRKIGFLKFVSDSSGSTQLSFTPARAELQYITIEYSLVHLRWWLPHLLAAEGSIQMGPLKTPIHYERSYTGYQVTGDTTATVVFRDSLPEPERRSCRPSSSMSINVEVGVQDTSSAARQRRMARDSAERRRQEAELARDTAQSRRIRERDEAIARDTARARRRREREECAKLYTVTVADSAALLTSTELPPSIFGDKEQLTSDPELEQIMNRLKKLADPPWQARAASFAWGLGGSGLVRYNKIEALSVGARHDFDFGRMRADATARLGVADLEPKAELGLSLATLNTQMRIAGYRRLDVMDEVSGMGGFWTSAGAFFLGRDERDYLRSTGGEVLIRPIDSNTQWYNIRLFAEQQRPLSNETDFSVRHLLSSSHVFDPNLRAERADQIGAALTLRTVWGQNPEGFRLASEAYVEGSQGTFDFVRESALLQLSAPLPFKLAGAVEVAAGTTQFSSNDLFDQPPLQSQWFLGGARTIRGYEIGNTFGPAFWRGRAELGTSLPAARVVLFSDFGWAGSTNNISKRASMWSVGAGGSFLDGLVRVDLARALRGSRAWRLHLSVDGIL